MLSYVLEEGVGCVDEMAIMLFGMITMVNLLSVTCLFSFSIILYSSLHGPGQGRIQGGGGS